MSYEYENGCLGVISGRLLSLSGGPPVALRWSFLRGDCNMAQVSAARVFLTPLAGHVASAGLHVDGPGATCGAIWAPGLPLSGTILCIFGLITY